MNSVRNALFFFLLCCTGCPANKGKEVLQPLAARTNEQIIQNLTREGLGTQGVREASERNAKSAEARQLALQARHDESIKENNRKLSQRFEHIQSMGGLQPALEDELQQLRASVRNIPPDKRAETIQRMTALEQDLVLLTACQQEPIIIGIEPSSPEIVDPDTLKLFQSGLAVTIGQDILINGCKFGVNHGKIYLILADGVRVALDPQTNPPSWKEDTIVALLKPLPVLLLDQDAILQIIREDGKHAEFPVKYIAQREFKIMGSGPGHNNSITGICPHSTQYDECGTGYLEAEYKNILHSIQATHATKWLDNLSSVSGKDEYLVNLKNRWAFYGTDFTWQGLSNCNWYSNQQGKVSDPVGIPTQVLSGAPTFSTNMSSVSFSVDWWVDVNCSQVLYTLDIYVVGPRGTTYY